MSRQTNYVLELSAGLTISMHLNKSHGEKIARRQTYTIDGVVHEVRTVKTVTVDDTKPTELEHIIKIIPWNEVQSAFSYVDEETGEAKLLTLDDSDTCKIFQKSDRMKGLGFVKGHVIAPHMFSGDHYFLSPRADNKTKKVSVNDQQAYTVLATALADRQHMFVSKFVSGDREKYGVIYVANDTLMLSVLIHSNYQREPTVIPKLEIPNVKDYARKLIDKCPFEFVPEALEDLYERALGEYIEQIKVAHKGDGGKTDAPKLKVRIRPERVSDFISQLDSLL
jgi:non-homologous end joining protein Ku